MIVLLASYPKSGNTWMRRFLCCYLAGERVPLSRMGGLINIDSDIGLWKRTLGSDAPGIEDNPFSRRPDFFRKLSQNAGDKICYLKTHVANVSINGMGMFPSDIDYKVIHIVRNPLDVIVSLSHHMDMSIDKAWQVMQNREYAIGTKLKDQYAQPVCSYLLHLKSWLRLKDNPSYLFIRYEDMHTKPITAFCNVLQHIGLPFNERRLVDALSWSNFEVMKQEEQKDGFNESVNKKIFFREGKMNNNAKKVPLDIRKDMFNTLGEACRGIGYHFT